MEATRDLSQVRSKCKSVLLGQVGSEVCVSNCLTFEWSRLHFSSVVCQNQCSRNWAFLWWAGEPIWSAGKMDVFLSMWGTSWKKHAHSLVLVLGLFGLPNFWINSNYHCVCFVSHLTVFGSLSKMYSCRSDFGRFSKGLFWGRPTFWTCEDLCWRAVQGAPCLLPSTCWKRLHPLWT